MASATLTANRALASCLREFPVIMGIIADAHKIKNETARNQVLEIIRCGLENADDTANAATYAEEMQRNLVDFARDFPTRAKYWEAMFYGSAQSMSVEAWYLFGVKRLNGHAIRWLHKRGLMG